MAPPKKKDGAAAKPGPRNLNAEAAVAAANIIKRLKKLGKLSGDALSEQAPVIVDILASSGWAQLYQHGIAVRKLAVATLGKVPPEALVAGGHVETLVTTLEDSDEGVRQAAIVALTTRLDALQLSMSCGHLLTNSLAHPLATTREAAVRVLTTLPPRELRDAAADAAAKLLTHPSDGVRVSALHVLGRLDARDLAGHVEALLQCLSDDFADVRHAAKRALGRVVEHDPQQLAPRAEALLRRLSAAPEGASEERAEAERALLANKTLLALLATTPPKNAYTTPPPSTES